jgi:nucleoid DNA-binding protein
VNHRQLVSAVARRFPDLTQRQIADVIAVLVEVWRAELAQPDGEIVIRDFGKLTVEVQQMKTSGVIRERLGSAAHDHLTRLYFRFRPTPGLRHQIESHFKEKA